MKDKNFKPGDIVPATGIYRIEHDEHRLMHEATFLEKTLFPQCRQCGTAVRFRLVRRLHARRVLPFRSTAILEEFDQRKRFIHIAS